MCSAQSLGTLVSGMANVYEANHDGPYCQAWREEAEAICKARSENDGQPQQNFNKNFYDNLEKKGLANDIKPEFPLAAESPTTGEVFDLQVLAQQGDVRALNVLQTALKLGERYLGRVSETTTYLDYLGKSQTQKAKPLAGKGMCSGVNSRIRGQFGGNFRGFHSDGVMSDGTVVEIKGPNDPRDPDQLRKQQKFAENGEVLIIDGQACANPTDHVTEAGNCKK